MTWKEENNSLCATFRFSNFTTAFAFMSEVAFWAEALNHHPNWTNVYNRVDFQLCTHDAGNIITSKDFELANKINEVFEKHQNTP